MADFNPDSADRKQVLHSLTARHQHILSILENSEPQGFITWDVSVEHDRENHFYRALQLGLAMLRTDCTDEWCVVGNGVFAEVRAMDIFHELETVEIACGMIYAGKIRKMKVYLRPWPAQPSTEFFIGHGNQCVKAVSLNCNAVFPGERPQGQPDAINPNMMPEMPVDPMGIDWPHTREEEYAAAAASVQRDRERQAKEEAGSPLWRTLHDWVTGSEDGRGNPI